MTEVVYVIDNRFGPSCKGGWITVSTPDPEPEPDGDQE